MLDQTQRQQLIDAARRAREAASTLQLQGGCRGFDHDQGDLLRLQHREHLLRATICAERVAIFTAVAGGCRGLTALAVIADTPEPVAPCGMCRQVLAEFSPDCRIIMANLAGQKRLVNLKELLPLAFRLPPRESGEGG